MKFNTYKIVLWTYILCLLSLLWLYSWADNELQKSKPIRIYPQVYKIYSPTVIEKQPEDIIEETENKIIRESEDIIVEEHFIMLRSYPNLQLSKDIGTVQGPQGVEKYYNLPMDNVIENMRGEGYTELDYPYYIREDGVKMFGDFIMVAADLNKYPRGTIVETTLGQGIVCDHCETPDVLDLAVNWN